MNKSSSWFSLRVLLAGAAAFTSITAVLVAQALPVIRGSPTNVITPTLMQPEDGVSNAEMVLLSDETISSIVEGICDRAMRYAEKEKIPTDRLADLRKAMDCSLEALFGKPDRFVEYQHEAGGVLNRKMLRSWLGQMHDWDLMASVSLDIEDDVELYKQAVKAFDKRYATTEAVGMQKIEAGSRLDLDFESPEWPFNSYRNQMCVWQPPHGSLTHSEGEAIKDGSTGRTFHVTVPVRYTHGGNGVLRVNFYWDEESEYWVPHMVIMAAGGEEGSMWPMHLF